MKELLFFLTNFRLSISMPITATLAWLTDKNGTDFETYFTGRPSPEEIKEFFPKTCDARKFIDLFMNLEDVSSGYMGGVAPFGENHLVDVYSLLAYYDIVVCTNAPESRRFQSFLKSPKIRVISMKTPQEAAAFYKDVFAYFDEKIPERAVMLPSTPFEPKGRMLIECYCYPEIYFPRKLGLDDSVSKDDLNQLYDLGLKQVDVIYCNESVISRLEDEGFKVRVIDSLRPDDTYGTVTKRIFERWKHLAEGVAYGDPNLITYWISFFCRKKLISMFDFDWENFAHIVAECANQVNTNIIWGRQLSDHFIPTISKYDKIFAIIDAGRPPITIKSKIPYSPAPIEKGPWDCEISDIQLARKAEEGFIPATILMYASDIRHLTITSNLFPLIALMRVKVGVAVPLDFYEYVPEWMDEVYTPYEQGGLMPYVEPIICSAGLGVATEAKGYISRGTLTSCLIKTREKILKLWGKASLPIGYYPFQDACPYYKHDTAEPQFEAIKSAGFQYCITYKKEGKPPEIVYEKDGFIAINQQSIHWTKNPLEDLKTWEEKIISEETAGWIIVSIDAPFWGFAFYNMKNGNLLVEAMNFIKNGGNSGKIFSASPHEIARYAKILRKITA